MSPALLSVRRPVFIAAIVILLLALGLLSLRKLPLDLFPDVSFPTIVVQTTYSGAGPQEVEMEISKILEDEVATISGVQKVSSENREGVSILSVEFSLKTNLDFAEQQVRAKVSNAMSLLPDDVEEPVIKRISPSDAPILGIALQADIPPAELYDLAKEVIKPQFEQVPQVGQVDIIGGQRREVHVTLDKNKLRAAEMSASAVVGALKSGGRNIPAGKVDSSTKEISFRTMAEYKSLADIANTPLRVASTSFGVTIGTVGTVQESLEDEVSRGRFDGKNALVFNVFRQTGANSVQVARDIFKKIDKVNEDLERQKIPAKLFVANDQTKRILDNVHDVYESIIFGVLLTVIVVYFFLGSLKSTLITGFALPNSLLGAFILMSYFNFSINIMSMLALSLVVGLLVDDAIVVRENIFRKLEAGMSPKRAAVAGTDQVTLAVVATTLTILAVFGPIGNLEGIVGQFFKQFGLTVCFAMVISLFDGLFVAPALSAYLGGGAHDPHAEPRNRLGAFNKALLQAFDRFQAMLERIYVWILRFALRLPSITLAAGLGVFIFSLVIAKFVPFTFLPPQDNGEFFVQFELPIGASLDATDEIAKKIEAEMRSMPQVAHLLTTVGGASGQGANKANIFVRLVPSKQRKENTTQVKNLVNEKLAGFKSYNLIVTDKDPGQGGGATRPFNLNLVGQDFKTLIPFAQKVLEKAKTHPALSQPDTSYREGKPEFQVVAKPGVAQIGGVTVTGIGEELRALIEGQTPAIYRQNGVDYDVRVRLQEDQRDLRAQFNSLMVPNLSGRVLPLANVATLKEAVGPSTIYRENRTRYVQISADLVPGGPGLGGAMKDFQAMSTGELKPPPGVSFSFVGEAERFKELMTNMVVSLGLGLMFIYLVLASLYGSFITPLTIMLVIPLAMSGAFFALFICRSSFDLFSMIGCVMLMGLATKNSILLLDSAAEYQREGMDRASALIKSGEARLRPILMTSLALIAGMVPVAVGLNEASKQRTSLGIVVIGGTISSTLLTLVVIPAAHMYIDRFQDWLLVKYHKIFGHDESVL